MTDNSALAAAEMDTASDVLDSAARAIDALRIALTGDQGATFGAVVDQLAHVGGRVILTGMGKSGYIARKIAATMASTGTLAVYVHPAEAAHGDLGMISKNDAVIAISNSGETAELLGVHRATLYRALRGQETSQAEARRRGAFVEDALTEADALAAGDQEGMKA